MKTSGCFFRLFGTGVVLLILLFIVFYILNRSGVDVVEEFKKHALLFTGIGTLVALAIAAISAMWES